MSSYGRGRGRGGHKKNYYGNNHNLSYGQLLDKAIEDSNKINKEKQEMEQGYYEEEQNNTYKNNSKKGNYGIEKHHKGGYHKNISNHGVTSATYDKSDNSYYKQDKNSYNNTRNYHTQSSHSYKDQNNPEFTQDNSNEYDTQANFDEYNNTGGNYNRNANYYNQNKKQQNFGQNKDYQYNNYRKGEGENKPFQENQGINTEKNFNNFYERDNNYNKKELIDLNVDRTSYESSGNYRSKGNKKADKNFNPDFPEYNAEFKRVQLKILDNEIKEEDRLNEEENLQIRKELREIEKAPEFEKASDLFNKTKNLTRGKIKEQNILQKILLKNKKVMDTPEIISNIIDIINSSKGDNEIQEEFTDLLGFEELEFIGELLQNRKEINEIINVVKIFVLENEKAEKMSQSQNIKSLASVGISIEQVDSKLKKTQNMNEMFEKRKLTNLKILEQLGFSNQYLRENQMLGLHEKKVQPLKLDSGSSLPIDDKNIIRFNTASKHSNQTIYSSERKKLQTHTEITIRPVLTKRPKATLVEVQSMPKWCQRAFNFKSFNEIQSTVFKKAFNDDENLLICAPTGAGKTNIALLTILREVSKNLKELMREEESEKHSDFKNIKWNFKIVYLVPLKALANEIVDKFKTSLSFLNIHVSEFSADVNLSKDQIEDTNLFVAIPEKWDLFTRKNDQVFQSLKLMIIDEVHLLNEDRGRVLESIVARTVRKAEMNQKFIRIAGLSATLPNYTDVAQFLLVKEGLFNFDASYRSTPLEMKFLGITDLKSSDKEFKEVENDLVYREITHYLQMGKQLLVFVHSRAETVNFAKEIIRKSQIYGQTSLFTSENPSKLRSVKFQNRSLEELAPYGIGFHNAGLLRKDRNYVENLFANKALSVLVSTSTLAWGVNLPAYCVIIKGVQFYDASKGSMIDMGILDIQQMFGRAGRPQFDNEGVAQIVCSINKIDYYVNLLKNQIEIESKLPKFLSDAINAEIAIGNILNLNDAINWLKLTYFSIRLKKNPNAYNYMMKEIKNMTQDEILGEIATKSLDNLNKFKLIRFVRSNSSVHSTELGRIASKYYMSHQSIAAFYEKLTDNMYDYDLLLLFSKTEEFSNMRITQEEKQELETLKSKFDIFKSQTYDESELSKPVVLLQTHLKGGYEFKNSSLHMDMLYIIDNSSRIMRAVLEISLHKHLVKTTFLILNYVKLIERRVFPGNTPLWQFTYDSNMSIGNKQNRFEGRDGFLSSDTCKRIDSNHLNSIQEILTEDVNILAKQLNTSKERVYDLRKYAESLPNFNYTVDAKPITRTIMNISITLNPKFTWKKRWNKFSEPFWIIVDNSKEIIHYEYISISNRNFQDNNNTRNKKKETIISFAVPFDINPGQKNADIEKYYNINILSDRWVGVEFSEHIHLNEIDVPQDQYVHTPLLDLFPLPKAALKNAKFESIFSFSHFNPVQTQVFHSCYNSDVNILCGAPTGSGKTVVAELTILRAFSQKPDSKIIYIAPLKSLAKERLRDWEVKMAKLDKKVIELTGDFTPDLKLLLEADILITTPEKWDGISRNWHHRLYVQKVCLVIIDEIHLLGLERGPILEVIVSRMRYISEKTKTHIRFVGLSTALANSYDVAAWLGINTNYDNQKPAGLFNFKPAVRPCPVTVHIEGFSEPHYCPRMGTMNKPAYNAIKDFSYKKPVLIFVSSRRQTRLTALDLISFCASDASHSYLKISEEEMRTIVQWVKDDNLKHTLLFGIGMHHAGLVESDRRIVEDLFYNSSIQILVATSTVAWGVNFPAHLVIIKGTEYYDAKSKGYVDMPITDVLQMIGRAGRPQYDESAVACLYVSQEKKNFYKKFLYEPFPLESNLHKMLHDHINAEICAGTLTTKKACVEYLSWTYFFRRLLKNPSYYGLEKVDSKIVNEFLNKMIDIILKSLEEAKTITVNSDGTLGSNFLGYLSAFYYISYKTAHGFEMMLKPELEIKNLIEILSEAQEFGELPVRHNEEDLNEILAKICPYEVDMDNLDSPHIKTNLLIQAHLSRLPLPISDYVTDSKIVTDSSIRLILFMIDLSSEKNLLDTTINLIMLLQMVNQGLWISDSSLLALPYLEEEHVFNLGNECNITHLPQLIEVRENLNDILNICKIRIKTDEIKNLKNVLDKIPRINLTFRCYNLDQKSLDRVYQKPFIPRNDIQISVKLEKLNNEFDNFVVHSKIQKQKTCRWFLIIGNIKSNELLGIKKLSFRGCIKNNINIICPKEIDNESLQLFLFSDSYIGIDQQYAIKLEDINRKICKKYNIQNENYIMISKENENEFNENYDDVEPDFEKTEESEYEESLDDIVFD